MTSINGSTAIDALRFTATVFERAGARITGPDDAVKSDRTGASSNILENEASPLEEIAAQRNADGASGVAGSTVLTAQSLPFLGAIELETNQNAADFLSQASKNGDQASLALQASKAYDKGGQEPQSPRVNAAFQSSDPDKAGVISASRADSEKI